MGADSPDIVALFEQIDADHSGDLNRAELQVGVLQCTHIRPLVRATSRGASRTRAALRPACIRRDLQTKRVPMCVLW